MKNTDLFQKRRSTLGSTYSRTLFVIPSGLDVKRSHSVKYRFKPASDFAYLCGLHLSGALLLILGEKTYLLYENHEDKIWGEGTVLTDDDISLSKGVIFESLNRLQEIVRGHINEIDRIAVSLNRDHNLDNVRKRASPQGNIQKWTSC